jgi:hypothetical protein
LQAPVDDDFRGIFIVIIVEYHFSTLKFFNPTNTLLDRWEPGVAVKEK